MNSRNSFGIKEYIMELARLYGIDFSSLAIDCLIKNIAKIFNNEIKISDIEVNAIYMGSEECITDKKIIELAYKWQLARLKSELGV